MRALCVLLVKVEDYLFFRGKVENWVILIETNSIGLLNFPFKVKILS